MEIKPLVPRARKLEPLSKLIRGYRDNVQLKIVQFGPLGESPTIFDPDSMASRELRNQVMGRFDEAMRNVAKINMSRHYIIIEVVIDR